MRHSLILMLLSSLALATAACPSSQQQPAEAPAGAATEAAPATREAASEDSCTDKQPTGDPPVCPTGCIWDSGNRKCIQDRGVIVDQRPELPVRNPDVSPMPAPTVAPTPAPTMNPTPAPTATPKPTK
ncbi:uncharacterized protein SOCE26_014930 [Sorangium cellulosum]|uniref:Secreted protein n=1 Tax=Sorangium cellulosum TaxID=56 RepID=A0A2L0ELC0_SORCE|nr:hypothetical protein [Sorangium cellulosum]AUX40096.1 uncharacterized protein SOCE26_014930 [Sorangium cellulosum]